MKPSQKFGAVSLKHPVWVRLEHLAIKVLSYINFQMIISHRNAQRILMSSLLKPKILCNTRLKQTVVAELNIFNEL